MTTHTSHRRTYTLRKHNQQVPLAIWAAISGKDETTFYLWHMTVPKMHCSVEGEGMHLTAEESAAYSFVSFIHQHIVL